MNAEQNRVNWVLGLVGAIAGGVLGYLVFFWIAQQGFYALALPGAALGLGCWLASGGRSVGLGVVCGVVGVIVGVITEWKFSPFVADGSLSFFLTHLGDLQPLTLIFIGLSGAFAGWFGVGRARSSTDRDREPRVAKEDQNKRTP